MMIMHHIVAVVVAVAVAVVHSNTVEYKVACSRRGRLLDNWLPQGVGVLVLVL